MVNDILKQVVFGNKVFDYCIAMVVFFIICLAIKIFKYIILKRLKKLANRTVTTFDDFLVSLIDKLAVPFGYLVGLYFALRYLKLPEQFDKAISVLTMAILTIFTVRLAVRVVSYALKIYWLKNSRSNDLEGSLNGILKVTKFILWSLAVIFFLDNLGFKISAVIAGLGVGGVAIALAAQAVLGDLFSYFAIIFDRPFEVGDFIIIGDLLGTVEHVGIKTTRIRSLGGEQLIFSNTDLTNSRVRNYKRMDKRRVVFKLGVVYQTALKELKEIPKIIEKVIRDVEDTAFDRAHFFEYADFSLVFEVVYYVVGSDYNKYMDIQQKINFDLKEEFQKRNIEFAFPTQTVYVSKES